MQLQIDSGIGRVTGSQLAAALLAAIATLILVQRGLLILVHVFGNPTVLGLVDDFDFGGEPNITARVSAPLMLACSAALVLTGSLAGGGDHRFSWFLLAGVFAFLAVDEAILIHEFASEPRREILTAGSVPQLAWLLPYGAVMLVLATVMLPRFLRVDRSSQIRFAAAGLLFVSGAIGGAIGFERLELVQMQDILAKNPDTVVNEPQHPVVHFLILVEESLELTGLGVFLHARVHRLGGFALRPGT